MGTLSRRPLLTLSLVSEAELALPHIFADSHPSGSIIFNACPWLDDIWLTAHRVLSHSVKHYAYPSFMP